MWPIGGAKHQYYKDGQGEQLPCAGVYERLMLASSSEKELEIVRDLSRTYPSHVYYQQRQGPGQRSLFNVLRAYSVYDRQVSAASNGLTKSWCQLRLVSHARLCCVQQNHMQL